MRPNRLAHPCRRAAAAPLVVVPPLVLVLAGALLVVGAPTAGAGAASAPTGRAVAVSGGLATGPVRAAVRQVPVTGVDRAAADALRAEQGARALTGLVALSRSLPARGYATVGVVWDPTAATPAVEPEVRTLVDGAWSAWTGLHVDAEHGPDPGTAEAERSRPGTDPYVVGDVDRVQLRLVAPAGGRAPSGLTLVIVNPDTVDPDTVDPADSESRLGRPAYPKTDGNGQATRRPAIYSRAQWGADESIRDGFAGYGEITGSFVHHTVNANGYTAAEVPSILRAIYAYHVQGRGWSDIGYNFLVDRFGRIWEGRWGGIGRPVIGAHTLGYNEESFAMSAIGNYETAQPTDAMLKAYGRLYAWKLSLHGVAPKGAVHIDGHAFKAINGHRDAAATACPGQHLYDRLGRIREIAATSQRPFKKRGLGRSVVADARPDLLVRDGERLNLLAGSAEATMLTDAGRVKGRWSSYSWLRLVGDWDGDGNRDLMGREDGVMWLFPGHGGGRFGPRVGGWEGWGSRTLLTPLGDWNGDGRPDLAARVSGGALWLFPGLGRDGLGSGYPLGSGFGGVGRVLGVGRWTADGAPDLMTRGGDGDLYLWPGNGPGGLRAPRRVADLGGYDLMLGMGDLDRDGDPDLVARDTTSHRLYLLPGEAGGGLGKRVPIGAGPVDGDLLG